MIEFGPPPSLAALVVATTLALPASAQNLLTNGGFEEPVVASWSVFPTIPGWSSTGSGIEIQRGVAGTPFEGVQLMELDSFGTSSAYQDFATVPGVTYRLRLHYSPRPGVGDSRIEVLWDGLSVQLLDRTGVGLLDTAWTLHELDLVAASTTTRLEVVDRGASDGVGGYLDDLCVARSGICVLVLAVHFDSVAAWVERHDDRSSTVITWTTASEDGTLGFVVEGGDAAGGPFVEVGDVVGAVGSGHSYLVRDDFPGPRATTRWYRVIELTVDGPGSISAPFQPEPIGAPRGGASQRGRTRHRPRG